MPVTNHAHANGSSLAAAVHHSGFGGDAGGELAQLSRTLGSSSEMTQCHPLVHENGYEYCDPHFEVEPVAFFRNSQGNYLAHPRIRTFEEGCTCGDD
mmetsp:Transcript_15904/g.31907  ORF Transcript_15904/g.31907 Transcript_15904/m.31907 type:complete len:97 (+) Transcript_15904:3592-3882(+)